MIILDQVDPSLSDINQRSFYFLILPDSSSGLFVVIRPTSQLSSLSLQCCVAIGFASQSIPGMKAFQFGLEMRFFFTYITRVTRIYGSQQKKLVIVKCSVRTIRQQYNGKWFLIINYCFIIGFFMSFISKIIGIVFIFLFSNEEWQKNKSCYKQFSIKAIARLVQYYKPKP